MIKIAQQLHRLLDRVEGQPMAMLALARQFRGAGEAALAIELAERARTIPPADDGMRTLAGQFLSEGVPPWHFVIVRDAARNEAYEAALKRAVRPGSRVLEIGTGTGLLAMMAARAGAQVVTCEVNPAVAAAARSVIAANGLSEAVRVINKHSDDLDLDTDLGGPADILVSEIVSNDVVGQGVLPAHRNAARLLRPDARVIPGKARVRVALADYRPPNDGLMAMVAGFDLTAFNRLARPYREAPVQSPHLTLRSEAADLFDFDLGRPGAMKPSRSSAELASSGGTVNGAVQWMALDMDEVGRYENRPGGAPSCWAAVFWPFERADDTRPGDRITVAGRSDERALQIWRRHAS